MSLSEYTGLLFLMKIEKLMKKQGHIRLFYFRNERKRKRAKLKAKENRIKRAQRKREKYKRQRVNISYNQRLERTLFAPQRFSLLEDPEEVIGFINQIDELYTKTPNVKSVKFELRDITSIDIGAICLLLSKLNELSKRKINNWGTFPKNSECQKIIRESGFLDRMSEMGSGKPFIRHNDNLILNRGFDKTDNAATAREIRKAVKYLTGKENNYKPIYSISQEICANSVEHGNEDTYKKNWLFTTSYQSDQVIFTMTDIGEGILSTLRRKFLKQIQESFKEPIDILLNAFEKQYESRTKDPNRNKGLPKIYKTSSKKYIENLIVITNNVLLNFDNLGKSKILKKKFKGTFYLWILNKKCIERWERRFEI